MVVPALANPRTRRLKGAARDPIRPKAPRMKLVVIEDSPTVRGAILDRLCDEPAISVVGVASNAAQGYTTVLISKPDVVVLDLSLPDGSGLELLERLRDQSCGARIFVLTSLPRDKAAMPAALSGANGYYDKSEGLDRLIQDLLDVDDNAAVHRMRRVHQALGDERAPAPASAS